MARRPARTRRSDIGRGPGSCGPGMRACTLDRSPARRVAATRNTASEGMTIRYQILKNDNDEHEIWASMDDVLHWLDSLPQHSNVPIAGGVATEIKRMLVESVQGGLDELARTQGGS